MRRGHGCDGLRLPYHRRQEYHVLYRKRHCIKGNANTYELARKIERLIFPSHYHIKVAVAGCPNDCVKANFNDFGIMGINKQVYDIDRCIGCGSCVDACKHHATGVLSLNQNGKIDKDACCCVAAANVPDLSHRSMDQGR